MNIAKRLLIMTGRDGVRPIKGSSMNIAESIVIVTGASSGIGAAIARELARRGATVVLAARRVEELNQMAGDLTQLGHKVLAVPTDVRSRESIDHLVTQTVTAYGRVDGVVNVAGIGEAGIIEHASDEVLEAMVMVNLLAPARLIQAALPYMKHDGSAAIVNIGSIAGEMGTNGMYSATKFGIRGLSDSLRRELWSRRIAVSLIEPGYIRTALTAQMKGRLPGPEIVAQAVASVLEHPLRVLVVPSSWRFLLLGVRLFPAVADRLFGSPQGQARLHFNSEYRKDEGHVKAR
ncbi:short-chain dehydrogenase [Reticulibacter mediterranei]|uniref:Short-chain dehydrogenase n=1 Tax=Reticulibacter mediterranei TaxID=2778369 RepID=A0A8J3IYG2_9CHLR|nr:SDR family oxidoreductase [Reticulibacter mediterranei]GHP00250.1 short-chain dehydrogenase [Reticulibacter mediterranei]